MRATFRLTGAVLLAGTMLLTALHAGAHPSHSSYAEIEWSTEGTLDVAFRVIPEDLERALSVSAGARLVLVDTPEVREALQAYISQHFALEPARDAQTPEILGMELGYRETWIYFSLRGSAAQGQVLRNTLLMDIEATQTNWVRRMWAPDEPALVFSTEEPTRALAVSVDTP